MHSPTPDEIQALLGKPGEGLPFVIRIMNRLFLKPLVIRKVSWERCESQFLIAHEKISKELREISNEKITDRVLVPSQLGLEDSSRYWSVAMVARHLTIVGQGMEKLIVGLTRGETILMQVDIAKVKPEVVNNRKDVLNDYFLFADGVIGRMNSALGDKLSPKTHVHPWFGALTAKDWFWLLGTHSFIHLKQIRRIKSSLSS